MWHCSVCVTVRLCWSCQWRNVCQKFWRCQQNICKQSSFRVLCSTLIQFDHHHGWVRGQGQGQDSSRPRPKPVVFEANEKKLCSRHKYFTSIRCQHFFIKLSQQQWSQYMKLSTHLFHSISTQNISAGLSMQQWRHVILANNIYQWPNQKSKQKNVHFYITN